MNLPKVIGREELAFLDFNGRVCEICERHMHDHEWVVLDASGFSIFCSSLKFERRDLPEVIAVEHYDDGEESTFSYGTTMNHARLTVTATNNAERRLGVDGLDRVEIFSRAQYTFNGPKLISVKLGDWSEQ